MRIALTAISILAILALFGCGSGSSESVEEVGGSESSEHGTSSESSEEGESSESGEGGTRSESGEHSSGSESGEHGEDSEESEDGEESGTQYGLDDTYDNVRAGAQADCFVSLRQQYFYGDCRERNQRHAEARTCGGSPFQRNRVGADNPG